MTTSRIAERVLIEQLRRTFQFRTPRAWITNPNGNPEDDPAFYARQRTNDVADLRDLIVALRARRESYENQNRGMLDFDTVAFEWRTFPRSEVPWPKAAAALGVTEFFRALRVYAAIAERGPAITKADARELLEMTESTTSDACYARVRAALREYCIRNGIRIPRSVCRAWAEAAMKPEEV